MDRGDWTLLTIASGESPLTPVQLQKVLFLLGQDLPEAIDDRFYRFRPYNYGPFDSAVYSDAERLATEGFVDLVRLPGFAWSHYAATAAGTRKAMLLGKELRPSTAEHIRALVEWAQGLSFTQLVRAVYRRYPEFRKNSVFQE